MGGGLKTTSLGNKEKGAKMDQDRQIRFLIPPLIFILSLLWGCHQAGYNLTNILGTDSLKSILGLLAAGAVTAIALGFIIGAVSIIILRYSFKIFKKPTYEIVVSKDSLNRIWPQLKTTLAVDNSKILFGGVTFDHELISDGIHSWLTRRWSAFNISVNSSVALLLSHLVAFFIPINQSYTWGFTSVLIGICFILNAIAAWKETMGMIEFQSYREHVK
jgi:hypothetical protein